MSSQKVTAANLDALVVRKCTASICATHRVHAASVSVVYRISENADLFTETWAAGQGHALPRARKVRPRRTGGCRENPHNTALDRWLPIPSRTCGPSGLQSCSTTLTK